MLPATTAAAATSTKEGVNADVVGFVAIWRNSTLPPSSAPLAYEFVLITLYVTNVHEVLSLNALHPFISRTC